ncbi:MAG TPA: hypothetical protein VFH49_08700 [Aquabacterium sp.]|nr:hypothetical protein [Aquabacterium sp.]
MSNEPKFAAVFDRRETIIESLTKDAGTLAMVVLCIYVSQGSKWWTLATGLMFVAWIFGVAARAAKRNKTFTSKADLLKWANSLEEEA